MARVLNVKLACWYFTQHSYSSTSAFKETYYLIYSNYWYL